MLDVERQARGVGEAEQRPREPDLEHLVLGRNERPLVEVPALLALGYDVEAAFESLDRVRP